MATAENDLLGAIKANPSQASAMNVLSHMYIIEGRSADVVGGGVARLRLDRGSAIRLRLDRAPLRDRRRIALPSEKEGEEHN